MLSLNQEVIETTVDIAKNAGFAIMDIYNSGDFDIQMKNDAISSPLTKADLVANDIIVRRLKLLTPTIHIVTEEDEKSHSVGSNSEYWLVDPLDGTKEFIKKNGEFTVNIGLIRDSKPVFGVVYAPATNVLYFGSVEQDSYKVAGGEKQKINVSSHEPPIVVVSRSHINEETEKYIKNNYPSRKLIRSGSSLKICLVADGSADCYPRLAPTMEWDTAAADAVLRGAGGIMETADGEVFVYGKKNLFNPNFICKTPN